MAPLARRTFPLLLAAGLLLGARPAVADGWTVEDFVGRRSEWDGFPVGTSVHVRRTNEVREPGREAPAIHRDEMKRKLVEVRDDAIVLEVSQRVGDAWNTLRQTLPRRDLAQVTTEDVGEAALRVGNADFPCRKTLVRRPGPRGPEEVVLWANPLHGILRIEMRSPAVSVLTATDLAPKAEVAGRALAAREFALETGGTGPKRVGTVVLSLEVPEAMVSQDIRAPGDPPPFRALVELVALDVPKPADAPKDGPPAQDGQGTASGR